MSSVLRTAVTTATALSRRRRRLASSGVTRRTFIRLDGVNQRGLNVDALATAAFPGGSPNGPAGSFTFVAWLRCDHAVGEYMYLVSASAGTEVAGWLYWAQEPTAGSLSIQAHHRKYVGGTATVSRSTVIGAAPHPWVSVGGEWRFTATTLTADGFRYWVDGAWSPTSAVSATDSGIYVHPIGKRFVLGDRATSTGVEGTHPYAGDIRAPAVYTTALSEADLLAIEAAGPTYDHAAAGAAGWWPGDGATYPTLPNLGSAGSAWDLTLQNGSQAMIMEV